MVRCFDTKILFYAKGTNITKLYNRYYSNFKIPNNIYRNKAIGTNVLRPSPAEILHPFYDPTDLECFTVCLNQSNPSFLQGKQQFPKVVKSARFMDHLELEIVGTDMKFKSNKNLSSWVANFRSFLNNINELNDNRNFVEITQKDIINFNRPGFIDEKILPRITEITELMKQNSKENPVEGLALNSLIDYILLDSGRGIFAEDIYIYLLQQQCNNLEDINLILKSIEYHLNTAVFDQVNILEHLFSQILLTIETENIIPDDQVLLQINKLI